MEDALTRARDGRLAWSAEPTVFDLSMLEVNSRYSVPRRVAYPVNPMRRFCGEPAAGLAPDAAGETLGCVAALLQWAYGYHNPKPLAPRRLTRRAPSAGALYPIECFVLGHADGRWRTYYYDFAGQLYHPVDQPGADELARQLGADRNTTVVVLAAVLWRSAQRYGARSYLYCSLDAGNIVGNLVTAAQQHGIDVDVTPRSMTQEHERGLGLREGEGALVSLSIRARDSRGVAPPSTPGAVLQPRAASLQPPFFSPILSRVNRFHAQGLSPRRLPLALLPASDEADYPQVIDRRHSAAAFAGRQPDRDDVAAMAERCGELFRSLEPLGAPRMAGSVVAVRTPQASPCARTIRGDGSLERGERFVGDVEAATTRLVLACQGQEIVRASAFAIVLGVDLEYLAQHGHGGYRAAALTAGVVCASLYREAARRGVGTTSIGGFHSERVRQLVGAPGWWPLVIQVFGVEESVSEKRDAAVIPLTRKWRNE